MKVVEWLKLNQCPNCKCEGLIAIETDSSAFDVDEEGNRTPYFNTFDSTIKDSLYCPNCRSEFDAIVEYNQIRRRDLRIKPLSESIIKKPVNPFYGE